VSGQGRRRASIDGSSSLIFPISSEFESLSSETLICANKYEAKTYGKASHPRSHPHTPVPRHPCRPTPSIPRRWEVRASRAPGGALALTLAPDLFRSASVTLRASRSVWAGRAIRRRSHSILHVLSGPYSAAAMELLIRALIRVLQVSRAPEHHSLEEVGHHEAPTAGSTST
jgi:hypothetical protein